MSLVADDLIVTFIKTTIVFRNGYYIPYSEIEGNLLKYAIDSGLDISQPEIAAYWAAINTTKKG
jgi:hypothetical protein